MTDKKLLQDAARAAGIEIEFLEPSGQCFRKNAGAWNPLELSDDALDLAISLGLQIDTRAPETHVFGAAEGRIDEHHRKDPYAATRRAIVRAAAAIGRGE